MLTAFAWCAAGLALLIGGAELIVRGGTSVAARLGIPPLIVGLTIVAIGTSMPELAVGIDAALRGEGELAAGNIVGANMVNILLILGLSALIQPLAIRSQTIRMDLPIIVIAALMLQAAVWNGTLSRLEGIIFVLAALAYTLLLLRAALREPKGKETDPGEVEAAPSVTEPLNMMRSFALLVGGMVIVIIGADWMVNGSITLARRWGVSDAFIGLTVVAIGTTAPELITTLVATFRGKRDLAIGNLLGSSIYNILFILGIICIVAGGISVGPALVHVEIPLMIAVALVLVPVFASGRKVTRLEGALFVSAYAAFLAFLIITRREF